MKRIAINGFGRIGRLTFRNLIKSEDIEIVAINDLTDMDTLAHLMRYDSAHGRFDGKIEVNKDHIIVNGKKINTYAERDPKNLPWKELNIDVVLESTGVFTTKDKASMHIEAGAKKVILSAPAKSEGFKTIVLGVNEDKIGNEIYFSNASCTTNCLAPTLKVLDQEFGIVRGTMTTTHAYTADQNIQDAPHKDLRRARAAAFNIVPTTTGAAKAAAVVYPPIKDKLFAMAVRVPVITGSMIEVTVEVEKDATRESINEVFKKQAEGPMKGIIEYCEDPIVSSDIIGNPASCIFDAELTETMGNLVKIVGWYDNEAGYSARYADLTRKV